jgi:hypothetical protein
MSFTKYQFFWYILYSNTVLSEINYVCSLLSYLLKIGVKYSKNTIPVKLSIMQQKSLWPSTALKIHFFKKLYNSTIWTKKILYYCIERELFDITNFFNKFIISVKLSLCLQPLSNNWQQQPVWISYSFKTTTKLTSLFWINLWTMAT